MVKKIICDTNIWYGIGNGFIKPHQFSNVTLFVTKLTIDELIHSDKLLYNFKYLSNACKAILKYANEWIYNEPIPHLVGVFSKGKVESFKIEGYNAIDLISKANNFNEIGISKEEVVFYSNYRKKYLDNLLSSLNFIFDIRNAIRTSEQIYCQEKKYLKNPNTKVNIINCIKRQVFSAIKKNINKKCFEENISEIELFINVLSQFIINRIREKDKPHFEINDFYDALQFCYVNKNFSIWTNENKWCSLIEDSGYKQYIFQPKK